MNDMLKKVKERLDILDNSLDSKITCYLEDFVNKINSICNREDFPEKLEYLAIRYAMNCTVFYKNGYGEGKQVVSSLKDGEQTVSFKDVGAVTADDVDVNKFIESNMHEISRYAYMGW